MKIKLKYFPTKNKKINFAIRIIVIYVISFLIAKYSRAIYEMGIFSNNIISIAIIAIVWLYRFLSYAVIPALIFLFLADFLIKKFSTKNCIENII